ncbi:helix-turn-helix transcriptional regulator [uncultured Alistipes sp.]|uniref:helix-turn-helix domain-containing protein n=1 Tax=uncultured Alistipes sp. TaxID=538949 RepID=UPI002591CDCE|nr:helix-turn-helix transcriptional regulator [uncultured Alistipes sp.]
MGQPRSNKILLQAIAVRLRSLRKERNLSQIDVYIDTDIHIGRIERGQTNISVTTLSDICDYYQISLHEFFKETDYPKNKQ